MEKPKRGFLFYVTKRWWPTFALLFAVAALIETVISGSDGWFVAIAFLLSIVLTIHAIFYGKEKIWTSLEEFDASDEGKVSNYATRYLALYTGASLLIFYGAIFWASEYFQINDFVFTVLPAFLSLAVGTTLARRQVQRKFKL